MYRAAKSAGRTGCENLFLTAVREQWEENTTRFVASYVDSEKAPRTYAYFHKLFEQRELLGAKSLAIISGKKMIF